MNPLGQLCLKIRAVTQLGFRQSLNYLLYQLGLRSGIFVLLTPPLEISALLPEDQLQPNWFLALPDQAHMRRITSAGQAACLAEADMVMERQINYFFGELKTLAFSPEKESLHWTRYESGAARANIKDIKYAWEPARFNWAVALAKAWFFSGDQKYAGAFWQFFEEFSQANPVNRGLNWTSAQEVALRLIALVLCGHLFKDAPASTPERMRALLVSIADHAARIPPTLCYARAQNNNHLLSEAVGLYTAGVFLPRHPDSKKWRAKGLRWFNQAVCSQIAVDGTYVQHSANYHRLMLMLSLWMQLLLEKENQVLEDKALTRLAAAAQWLAVRLDESSGCVPNLGHNDGSHFLPLSSLPFQDYRPVLQAASRAFLARPALPPGPWDDLCLWFDLPLNAQHAGHLSTNQRLDHLILGDRYSWASLRAVTFSSRPAHADQLHVDIWHKGINFALDAGTFQYNAPPPWENALAATRVHNTVTVNGRDQMTRVSKFLWLDWAQAEVEEISPLSLSAVHFGYKRCGVLHRRRLEKAQGAEWVITDELLPVGVPSQEIKAELNWLVPDWPYEFHAERISLESPLGETLIVISSPSHQDQAILDLFRSGESLLNGGRVACLGWYSPTYGVKQPALSIRCAVSGILPVMFRTVFRLPD